MQLEYKVTVGENGRLILPIKIREQLNLLTGDQVMLVLNEELKLIPLKDKVRKLQAMIKSRNPENISLVDSLIESRRKESRDE
jgi:AbrB family looped-hinge helix DNA binding protein